MKKYKSITGYIATSVLIYIFIFLLIEKLPAQSCEQVEIIYQQSPCNPVLPIKVNQEGDKRKVINACVDQSFTYSATGTGGTNDSFLWEVTGPTNVNILPNNGAQTIIIYWPLAGLYSLELSVNDGLGNSFTNSILVNVNDKPHADFTFSPNNVCAVSSIFFNNTTTFSGEVAWQWDFGDLPSASDNYSDEKYPVHTYSTPGSYSVTLVAYSFNIVETIIPAGASNERDTVLSIQTCCADTVKKVVTILPGNVSIDCISTVCAGDTSDYIINGCSNPTAIATGGVVTSSSGNNITIVWGDGSTQGLIQVQCPTGCLATVPVPIIPSNPIPDGNLNPCVNGITSYTLPLLPGTFYSWTLENSSGSNFNNYLNTYPDNNTVWVNWNSLVAGVYSLSITLENKHICCNSNGNIQINLKRPFTIYGNQTICKGNSLQLSASPNQGVFNWEIFNSIGNSIASNTGSTFSYPMNDPGNYIVNVSENSGIYCNSTQQVNVTVLDIPAPGTIAGPSTGCPGSVYNYSMSSPAPAGFYYQWSLSAGSGFFQPGSISTPITGNDVSVVWNILPATVSVVLKRNSFPLCPSSTVTKTVTKGSIGTIFGSTTVCADNEEGYSLSGSTLPSGETITWTITPAERGMVSLGQGTNTVNIYWYGNGPSAIITATSNCGQTPPKTVNINIPTTGTITKTGTDLCTGVTLSAQNGQSGCTYSWFLNGQLYGNSQTISITQGGAYSVTYTNTNGCKVTKTWIEPIANDCQLIITTPGPIRYCTGQTISTLLSASVGSGCSGYGYQWYLNNNAITNATSLTYTALTTGNYYVIATRGSCVKQSQTISITQGDCPNPGCTCVPLTGTYTISQTPNCNPVSFSTTYPSVFWDFGDGYSSTGTTTSHQYSSPGYFTVQTVVPCANTPCVQIFTDIVFIPIAPDFNFSIDVCTTTASFINLSQVFAGNGGTMSSLLWNFGDPLSGALNTVSNQQTPSHNYPNSGTYTVTLTATYTDSDPAHTCTASVSQQVIITAPGQPTIVNPITVCTNAPSLFTTSTNGMLSYIWEFGDGSFGYLQTLPHSYANSGTKQVKLTVTDYNGCTASTTITIIVLPGINSCQIQPGFICPDGMTNLNAPTGFSSYQWQQQTSTTNFVNIGFNNNQVSITEPGWYQVIVTNNDGCTLTSNLVEVKEVAAPKAIIVATPSSRLCNPGSITLSAPYLQDQYYLWEDVNGILTINPNSNFFITIPNLLQTTTFRLTVSNAYGCKDICELTVEINTPPMPPVIAPSGILCEGVPITLTVTNYTNNLIWNIGATGPSITVSVAGTYTATYTDPTTGCTSSKSVTVYRNPPVGLFPHLCDTIPCDCRNNDENQSFTIYAPKPLIGEFQENYIIDWYSSSTNIIQSGGYQLNNVVSGTYHIVVTNPLTHCTSTSSEYTVVVPPCDSCSCANSHWGKATTAFGSYNGDAVCGATYHPACNQIVNFDANYICDSADCQKKVTYTLQGPGGVTTGEMPLIFPATEGTFTLQTYGWCGDIICDSCKYYYVVECDSICCPQINEINVSHSKDVLSQQTYQGYNYSLFTTQLNIVGGTTPYSEVRADVIDFQLTANYNDCIDCTNKPFTWASLSATYLAGIQPSTSGVTPAVGYFVPSNIYGNPREVVWNNGSLIDLSSAQGTSISFFLPPLSKIPCCALKAKVCVKFSFRDINCNLCEKVECFEIVIGDTVSQASCCCDYWNKGPVRIIAIKDDSERNPDPATPKPSALSVNCGASITLAPGKYKITAPTFFCNPNNAACTATYTWSIGGGSVSDAIIGQGTGNSFSFDFTNPGTYLVTITPKCGSCACAPCTFTIIIKPLDCNCGNWTVSEVVINWKDPKPFSDKIKCNDPNAFTISRSCSSVPVTGTFGTYICTPSDCQVKYSWVVLDSGNVIVGQGTNTTSDKYSFLPTKAGAYTLKVTAICGNKKCGQCVIKINIKALAKC